MRWQWVTPWGFESLRAHHFTKSTLITDARLDLALDLAGPMFRQTATRTDNRAMRRLITIALASVFTLVGTVALAGTVRHKPSVRTHDLHRAIPQPGSVRPNYGDPAGSTGVSAGGYLWNGRSASEWGGG